MALKNRMNRVIRGGITSTGNTLGITSGTATGNNYSTTAFISTNTALQVPGYPVGTTTNYALASSRAYLNIPSGSTVIYAELMWVTYGNATPPPVQSITFSTPTQSNITIAPVPADIVNFAAYGFNWAWNNADVTSYVNTAGSGYYTVGNVYSQSLTSGIPGVSWTLVVAYENQGFSYRYVTINTGFSFVSDTLPNTYTMTNFVTPSSGTPKGYLLMAYSFGDFGDRANLQVGPTTSSLTQIGNTGSTAVAWNGSAPYNPRTNMFTSLICVADPENTNIGKLDTRGTFGAYNAVAYGTPGYQAFSRTLYDIAGFDISNTLSNNQNTLNVKISFTGTGGSALIQNESVQVDVQSANLAPLNKKVDKVYATLGDTLTFTITTTNVGLITADNVVFIDTIPNGTTFVSGSVFVNNVLQSTANPSPPSGIALGSIGPNVTTTIIFSVRVNTTVPFANNPVLNQGTVGYSFVSGPSIPPVNTSTASSITTTTINYTNLTASKSNNKTYADVGDILTYTIPISNTGNTTALSVTFIDTIPNGTVLVAGSLKADGVAIGGSPNPPGVTLSNIGIGKTTTLTFNVSIKTLPIPNPIPNTAYVICSYTIDPSTLPNVTGKNAVTTNSVFTQVNHASIANPIKIVDKVYASCGDTLTYTIVIQNTGTATALNMILKDTIPTNTVLIPNSVYVNTLPKNVTHLESLDLGSIGPNQTTTVTFKVIVQC